jgi:predicted DNA-binding transcriptional regulator AlpA
MSAATKVSTAERADLLRLPVWTRADICAYFGLSPVSFWRARTAGDLPEPMKRLGKLKVWDRDEVLFGMSGDRGRKVVGEACPGAGATPALAAGKDPHPFRPDFAFLRGAPAKPRLPRTPARVRRAVANCPEPAIG